MGDSQTGRGHQLCLHSWGHTKPVGPCGGGLERALWLWDGGAPTQPGPGPRVKQQLCLPWQDRHPRGVGQPHPDRAVLEGWPHAL